MSRRLVFLLWAAVLALALGLRLPALSAALPYTSYVDEGFILRPAAHLVAARTWDPGAYQYPSLPIYAVAAAVALDAPVYAAVHGRPLRGDLSPDPARLYDLIEPVDVIVLGRLLTLLVSLGVVVLAGLLARRLAGEEAGLFAALLAALVPALVIRSPIATVDPWAAFFVLAALLFAEGAARSGRPWRGALLAGAMTGCALTSKYPHVLVAVAVVAVLARIEGDWRRKARAVALAGAAGVLAALITMPALALRSGEVLSTLRHTSAGYGAAPANLNGFWHQAVERAEWDQPFPGPELGLPFLACAALGGLAAVWDRRFRGTVLAWELYAGALALLLTSYTIRPFRNLVPLVPLACVLASLLLIEIGERLRRPVWAGAVAVLGALVLLLPGDVGFARTRARVVDTRAQAIDWLEGHSGEDDLVLVSAELGIPRDELDRLPGTALELDLPHARGRLRRRADVRLVVTGRFGGTPDLPSLLDEKRTKAPYALVAQFGNQNGGGLRFNRRAVLVFRRADP
ncbi:MAG TPA: glycosyltransferase family 39 protein [Thermoanaerobaculia bacterium]|nr:glycosyltransferase family 39 protein [Thermoanaerobaculia bacterium]